MHFAIPRGGRALSGKIYINQPLNIVITCSLEGTQMTTAVSAVITYKKPDKSEGSWTATIDNIAGTVEYQASSTDINAAGDWILQPVVTFPAGKIIPSTTVKMTVSKRFT